MFLHLTAAVTDSGIEKVLSCFLVLYLNGTFCPRCGSLVPAEMMYCVTCGYNVRLNARDEVSKLEQAQRACGWNVRLNARVVDM